MKLIYFLFFDLFIFLFFILMFQIVIMEKYGLIIPKMNSHVTNDLILIRINIQFSTHNVHALNTKMPLMNVYHLKSVMIVLLMESDIRLVITVLFIYSLNKLFFINFLILIFTIIENQTKWCAFNMKYISNWRIYTKKKIKWITYFERIEHKILFIRNHDRN